MSGSPRLYVRSVLYRKCTALFQCLDTVQASSSHSQISTLDRKRSEKSSLWQTVSTELRLNYVEAKTTLLMTWEYFLFCCDYTPRQVISLVSFARQAEDVLDEPVSDHLQLQCITRVTDTVSLAVSGLRWICILDGCCVWKRSLYPLLWPGWCFLT